MDAVVKQVSEWLAAQSRRGFLSEAVWKGRLDPLKERLHRVCPVSAQRPCQALSNHFAHSL